MQPILHKRDQDQRVLIASLGIEGGPSGLCSNEREWPSLNKEITRCPNGNKAESLAFENRRARLSTEDEFFPDCYFGNDKSLATWARFWLLKEQYKQNLPPFSHIDEGLQEGIMLFQIEP